MTTHGHMRTEPWFGRWRWRTKTGRTDDRGWWKLGVNCGSGSAIVRDWVFGSSPGVVKARGEPWVGFGNSSGLGVREQSRGWSNLDSAIVRVRQ